MRYFNNITSCWCLEPTSWNCCMPQKNLGACEEVIQHVFPQKQTAWLNENSLASSLQKLEMQSKQKILMIKVIMIIFIGTKKRQSHSQFLFLAIFLPLPAPPPLPPQCWPKVLSLITLRGGEAGAKPAHFHMHRVLFASWLARRTNSIWYRHSLFFLELSRCTKHHLKVKNVFSWNWSSK